MSSESKANTLSPALSAHMCIKDTAPLLMPGVALCCSTGVRLPFVQYVASLAIVQAVQELARERLQVPSLPKHPRMHT